MVAVEIIVEVGVGSGVWVGVGVAVSAIMGIGEFTIVGVGEALVSANDTGLEPMGTIEIRACWACAGQDG
jgi:hypothetical protein